MARRLDEQMDRHVANVQAHPRNISALNNQFRGLIVHFLNKDILHDCISSVFSQIFNIGA